MGKLQLHQSGLATLSKCGEQFRRRYIENERTPSSVTAAIGTAVHKSSETDLRQKMQSGSLLQAEEVKDIARDAIVSAWPELERTPEDEEEGIDFSRDKAVDRSVSMAGFHHEALAPQMNPTHVEREWVLDINGLPIQLAGRIDWQEGHKAVGDLKTSAKSPAKDLANTSLQLTMYSLAIKAHDGVIPASVRLDYIVSTPKRGDTKLIQLESTRTARDFQPLLERIAQAARIIEAGNFTPAPADAWWCSGKICPFFTSCRFAVRPISISTAAQAA